MNSITCLTISVGGRWMNARHRFFEDLEFLIQLIDTADERWLRTDGSMFVDVVQCFLNINQGRRKSLSCIDAQRLTFALIRIWNEIKATITAADRLKPRSE